MLPALRQTMTNPPIDQPHAAKVPLRIQADEAQRELAMRHRVYPGLVKRGKMTELEANAAIAVMRAIRNTLRLFAEYEVPVRSAVEKAIEAARRAADDPSAQHVMAELGAVPAEIRITESGSEPVELEGAPDYPAVEGPAP